MSADFSTIMELKEAFEKNGIKNVTLNSIFKGGKITQSLCFNSNVEVIQIEINWKYRNINNMENLEKVCKALSNYINQYISIIK